MLPETLEQLRTMWRQITHDAIEFAHGTAFALRRESRRTAQVDSIPDEIRSDFLLECMFIQDDLATLEQIDDLREPFDIRP